MRIPQWARSVRFRLSLLYSSVLFVIASMVVGAIYVGLRRALSEPSEAAVLVQPGIVRIGDIYVEPVNLGWAKPGAYNIKVAYGFIAPTGKFDEDGTETTTTDYWGHEFTFATTRALGQTKLWQLSVNTNWEFHQKKRHEDVKVGNNMTLEYGVGKTIVKNQGKQLIQVGAVGYAEFQLTDDSGSDVSAFNRGNQDHAFGLGGEFGVIWPVSKFNFLVRVIPEFGVRSRTQGLTFVVAAGKSF